MFTFCMILLFGIGGIALIVMLISCTFGFLNPGKGHDYKPWEIRKLFFGDGDYVNPTMEPNYIKPVPDFSNETTKVNDVVEDE